MDRGAWQAMVREVTELDMTEATQHTRKALDQYVNVLQSWSVFLENLGVFLPKSNNQER